MAAELELLQQRLRYRFTNPGLALQAITHRSADRLHNERLEFLGDSVLGHIVARELYSRYPQAAEGDLSRMRASLVNRETLAELARELELGTLLRLGAGERKSGGKRRASILADALEALLAAVLLDSDLESTRELVLRLYGDRLRQLEAGQRGKDSKTALQEMLQARSLPLPEYTVLDISGEAHDQTFTVTCKVAMLESAVEGSGKSKRLAEQDAAQRTLELLTQHE